MSTPKALMIYSDVDLTGFALPEGFRAAWTTRYLDGVGLRT